MQGYFTGAWTGESSEFVEEPAAGEVKGGVTDGAAPVSLDGVGGSPSAGEDPG